MRDNGPYLLILAALTGVLGYRVIGPTPAQSTEKESKAIGVSSAKELRGSLPEPWQDFWWPLIDFFEVKIPEPSKRPAEPWCCFPHKEGWDLDCLIVTVPDPIDSTSGHCFDPLVDAIQRAVETQHYVLDRYYFPWQQFLSAETNAPAASDDSPPEYRIGFKHGAVVAQVKKDKKPPKRRIYERQPGMLLFRNIPQPEKQKQPEKPKLLVVLLVGETATAGVHKEALTNSLEFAKRLRAVEIDTRGYKLLSPYFSGSASSLAATIKQWRGGHHPCMKVVSGAATAIPEGFEAELGNKASFNTTVIPEDVVLNELLTFVKNNNNSRPVRFACLIESNTGFGESVSRKNKTANITWFPFPMNVSEVRAAYRQKAQQNDSILPILGNRLRIPPDEQKARDTEPTMQPQMNALATERVLADALKTIHRERYEYVSITATDVRDQVFLASLVRQQCPNAQFLFTSIHSLLIHEEYAPYLRGSLVGSTYPFYLRNQDWSFPYRGQEKKIALPSQEAYGYYNSAIFLLAPTETKSLLEYGHPFPSLSSCKNSRPPVWISLIAQNGFQPLKAQPIEESKDESKTQLVKGVSQYSVDGVPCFRPQYGGFWFPFFSVGAIVLFLVHWDHLRRSMNEQSEPTLTVSCLGLATLFFSWLMFLSVGYVCLIPFHDPCFRLSAVGIAFAALSALSFWAWRRMSTRLADTLKEGEEAAIQKCAYHKWEADGKKMGGDLAYWNAAKKEIDQLVREKKKTRESWARPAWGAIIFLVLCFLVVLFFFSGDRKLEPSQLFLVDRLTDFASGVNPSAPFFWLLLGTVFCLWMFLTNQTSGMPMDSPFPQDTPTAASIWENVKRFFGGIGVPLVFLAIVVYFVGSLLKSGRSVEGVWYDAALVIGFWAFVMLMVVAMVVTWREWKILENLLRKEVAPLHMQRAFARLPSRIRSSFGPSLTSPRERIFRVLRSEDFARPPGAAPAGKQMTLSDYALKGRDCLKELKAKYFDRFSLTEVALDEAEHRETGKAEDIFPVELHDMPNDPQDRSNRLVNEDFLALVILAYLNQYGHRLKRLLWIVTLGPLFFLLAVCSYPFAPQQAWLTLAGGLFLAAIILSMVIMTRLERDPVASRINGTTPNRLNWLQGEFSQNVVFHGVPLTLGIVATFPGLVELIHSWFDPLLMTFHFM